MELQPQPCPYSLILRQISVRLFLHVRNDEQLGDEKLQNRYGGEDNGNPARAKEGLGQIIVEQSNHDKEKLPCIHRHFENVNLL